MKTCHHTSIVSHKPRIGQCYTQEEINPSPLLEGRAQEKQPIFGIYLIIMQPLLAQPHHWLPRFCHQKKFPLYSVYLKPLVSDFLHEFYKQNTQINVIVDTNIIFYLLFILGNARTVMNSNASRFSQLISLDFDNSGMIASVSIQVKYIPII